MAPVSSRTCIIAAGTTLTIACIFLGLQNYSHQLASLKIKVDEIPTFVAAPSLARASVSPSSSISIDFYRNLTSGKMDPLDPILLQHLRDHWIYPPSMTPYNLAGPNRKTWDQIGQSGTVDKILKQRRNGFFVESGAADGESHSNSLFFEKYRDWKGLLIEPDPWSFESLVTKNRKAYAVNSGVAMGNSPVRADFTFASELGGIAAVSHKIPKAEQSSIKGTGRVQCFPIYSLLTAIGRSHVDFYTLDVEGAEVEILRTFPWEHITVNVWAIEYAVHGGGADTPVREKAIREIFEKTGLYGKGWIVGAQDIMFVRKDVK